MLELQNIIERNNQAAAQMLATGQRAYVNRPDPVIPNAVPSPGSLWSHRLLTCRPCLAVIVFALSLGALLLA